jgi:hypothetical protein
MRLDSDSDDDGATDGDEFVAGTDLLNPFSRLELLPPAVESEGGKMLVRWCSVSNHFYNLLLSTNLPSGFSTWLMNVPATAPINTYTDSVPHELLRFCKIEVVP